MTDDGIFEEWLTIAACAKRLALHERQIRRYAQRIKNTDRTPPGQIPLCVRVSAILAERDRTVFADTRIDVETATQDARQDTQDSVRPEQALTLQQIATIYEAQLQAKEAVIQAKDALIEEKDKRLSVLSDLSEGRKQEIARLEGEVQKLLTATPVTVEAEPLVQDRAESHQEAHTASELDKAGIHTLETLEVVQGSAAPEPRRWREFWR